MVGQLNELEEKASRTGEFTRYLNKAFAAYAKACADSGRPLPNEYDFANFLGVSASSYSNWKKGTRPPSDDNLKRLYMRLRDPRVYTIWGKSVPIPDEPEASQLMENWPYITHEQKKRLAALSIEFRENTENNGEKKEEFNNFGALPGLPG